MKNITIIIMAMMICACGVKGELSKESQNKTMECLDTRDHESYIFNTNTVRDIVISIGDACFTITDNKGVERKQCKSHEVFLKCVEKQVTP